MIDANRVHRVTELMVQQGLKQIVVSATPSVYYLTGLWIEPHERMLALYLTDQGRMTLFANEIFGVQSSDDLPVVNHKDGQEPTQNLARTIQPGTLGIDKFLYSKFLISLMEARPDMKPVHGSDPVDQARKCKDKTEQATARASSRINDQVMNEMIRSVRAGVQENELAAKVNRLFLERGADSEGPQLACFGANCADPHHDGDATVIQPGDSVIFDIFTPINRYWCDMTRTVFYGSVSPKQREVYNLVRKANEAAEAMAKPGVLLSELDRTARDIITAGGYGPYFTHRLGHGCGLDCHEPPDVSGTSDVVIQPGMIFSVEPGIYIPGEFGVRIEDLVLITETGCEVLNQYPKDLQVIPLDGLPSDGTR